MLTLALDTSTEWGSIALGQNQEILEYRKFQGPMRHSSTLFPMLEELRLSQLKLSRILVGLGPGSFSGIRVSLAAAHGIACAHQAEVRGVCSAWSVAQQHPDEPSLGVFADARRGEYYCTRFSLGQLTHPTYLLPRDQASEEIRSVGLALSAEALPAITHRAYPKASDYLLLPANSPILVQQTPLEPIYLREPTVALK